MLTFSCQAPANDVVDWEIRGFQIDQASAANYIGPPRPELERSWAELLGRMSPA